MVNIIWSWSFQAPLCLVVPPCSHQGMWLTASPNVWQTVSFAPQSWLPPWIMLHNLYHYGLLFLMVRKMFGKSRKIAKSMILLVNLFFDCEMTLWLNFPGLVGYAMMNCLNLAVGTQPNHVWLLGVMTLPSCSSHQAQQANQRWCLTHKPPMELVTLEQWGEVPPIYYSNATLTKWVLSRAQVPKVSPVIFLNFSYPWSLTLNSKELME